MSRNDLDDLLLRLIHDGELRREFEADRKSVLARFSLSDQETNVLMDYDVKGLTAAVTAISRPCAPAAIV